MFIAFISSLTSVSGLERTARNFAQVQYFTADEAEKYLSDNYEGDDFDGEEYEGDDYDGFDDETLSFGGNSASFRDELRHGVTFAFKLHNNTGQSQVIALWSAYFDRLKLDGTKEDGYTLKRTNTAQIVSAGFSDVTAVLTDGIIAGTGTTNVLTATAMRGSIEDFINFTKNNPTRIPKITVQSNGTNAYERAMRIHKVSPFRKFGDQIINMTEYFKTTQFQDKKIEIATGRFNLQFDDQTLVLLEMDSVVAGTATPMELIITLSIGAIKNPAGELYNKASRATRNIIKGKKVRRVKK